MWLGTFSRVSDPAIAEPSAIVAGLAQVTPPPEAPEIDPQSVVVVVEVVVDVTAIQVSGCTEKPLVPAKLDVSAPASSSALFSAASKAVASLPTSLAAWCTVCTISYDWQSSW